MTFTILCHSTISPSIHLIPPSLLLPLSLHISLVHAESQPFIQWFQHDTPCRQNVSLIWPCSNTRAHTRSTTARTGAIECLRIRPWLRSRDGEAECYHKQKSPCFYIKHKKGKILLSSLFRHRYVHATPNPSLHTEIREVGKKKTDP